MRPIHRAVRLFAVLIAFGPLFAAAVPAAPKLPAVAAKLDAGGTYYLLADQTYLPGQIRFLISLARPAVEPLLTAAEAPFSCDDVIAQVSRLWHGLGFSRIRSIGQSSLPIAGGGKEPVFFRNRLVLDTAGAAEVPPFLAFFAGAPVKLDDFLAATPSDILGASTFCCDFGAMWRWVNAQYPLPPEVATTIQLYAGCPAAEFFDGISGRMDCLLLPAAEEAAKAGGPFRIYCEMPDRANRVFKALAKFRMLDPDTAATVEFPLDEDAPVRQLTFLKLADRLAVATDPELPKFLAAARKSGATLANDLHLRRNAAGIPPRATGYIVENYRHFSPDLNRPDDQNRNRWTVGVFEIAPDGMVFTENDYFDWNGWGAKVLFGAFSQTARELPALLAAVRSAGEDDEEDDDPPESERLDLERVRDHLAHCREKHSGVPAEFGCAGWRNLAGEHPELKDLAEGRHTYLVYFGTVPAEKNASATLLSQLPLVLERPDLARDGRLGILFADGHVDRVAVPDSVESVEELVSYLHTQYRYREQDLNALCEQARKIDKELYGE